MAHSLSSLVSAANPQGGRFHLLAGKEDWQHCGEPDPHWARRTVLPEDGKHPPGNFGWDQDAGSLRLAHREAVTRHPSAGKVRRPDQRRGADRDRYGSWYWITPDARGILRLGPGADEAELWWHLDDLAAECDPTELNRTELNPADGSQSVSSRRGGGFGPAQRGTADDSARLAGLAITTGHRLAVGLVDEPGGLLMFDLHARGGELVLRWPGGQSITPFDLAGTAEGGVLVLDRVRRTWWELDSGWRLVAEVTSGAAEDFQPADDTLARRFFSERIVPRGHPLPAAGQHLVADPVAIAAGPGVVLILDRPQAGPSAIVVADPGSLTGVAVRLPLTVEALDPARPDQPAFVYDVIGQDLACSGAGETSPLSGPLLYIADASTSATEAYRLRIDPTGAELPRLEHQPEELPMRCWDAKGLVAVPGDVFYDAVGRWVPLEPFGICNMERQATLTTPASFAEHPVDGQPFDSSTPGCVWHRLMLDADLPNGCAILVAARASDDPELLGRLPFIPQPTPYLRGAGSELPWHDPWADLRRPVSNRVGTWELLFQQVQGRYVQLELTLTGNGRVTPTLRAVRVWYPRFSYVDEYLPEAYQEDDEPGRFLERMLANMEGMLTDHEARLEHAWMLADPRTSPVAALDWLASWVGLNLEPAWSTARRRFLLGHVNRMYCGRGTVGGLRSLLRLYLGCSLDEDVIFAPGPRSDDPARIVDRVGPHRFRVLIPSRLDVDQAAMVERIVLAARPAHASFEIRSFSGLLVIGEAKVGIDTVVGASPRFAPVVLGGTDGFENSSELGGGHLGAGHPFEITDRIVSDRDRLGEYPAL